MAPLVTEGIYIASLYSFFKGMLCNIQREIIMQINRMSHSGTCVYKALLLQCLQSANSPTILQSHSKSYIIIHIYITRFHRHFLNFETHNGLFYTVLRNAWAMILRKLTIYCNFLWVLYLLFCPTKLNKSSYAFVGNIQDYSSMKLLCSYAFLLRVLSILTQFLIGHHLM